MAYNPPLTSSLVCMVAVPPMLVALHMYSPSSEFSTSVTVREPVGAISDLPGMGDNSSPFLYQLTIE